MLTRLLRSMSGWVALVALSGVALHAQPAPVPAPTTRPAANQPVPSIEQLKELYAAGQYRLCLQQAVRASNLTGDAAKKYDKFELMLLRGDCLLRLEDSESAKYLFESARKSPNQRQAIEASATVQAINRSPMLKYRSKFGGEPISIADPESRRKAMATMVADDLADNSAKIKSAIEAKSLVPIMAILPAMLDMYALEVAGTNADTRTRADLAAMGQQARDLIGTDLGQIRQRVTAIESNANQRIDLAWAGGAWWYEGAARRGLHSDDRRALRDTIQYLQKVEDTLDRAHTISRELHGKIEKWEDLMRKAAEVRIHAESVLSAE